MPHKIKLSSQQKAEIKAKYSTGKYTYFQLAQEYKVSMAYIQGIVTNKEYYK